MSEGSENALIDAVVRQVLEQLRGADAAEVAEEVHARLKGDVAHPRDARALARIVRSTPARLGVGRCGTRYLTPMYLRLRADHAVAKDAVYSEVPAEFPRAMQCVELRTRARDREQYLLQPDLGRALHAESRALVERDGTRGADVQIILGDGLSAWALTLNAVALVPALERELAARDRSIGKRLFVRLARIAVADEIGVALGARSTVILVGERPGLGTGDSLSAYIAYGPKLGQDNAEKNCVSNIRPLGLAAIEAARAVADIVARAFEVGAGGVAASVLARDTGEPRQGKRRRS